MGPGRGQSRAVRGHAGSGRAHGPMVHVADGKMTGENKSTRKPLSLQESALPPGDSRTSPLSLGDSFGTSEGETCQGTQ